MIRVTPGVVADTHAAILTGHAGSKFGFSLAQAPRRDRAAARRRPGPTCAACTSTSARSSSTSSRGGWRSRRSPTLGDFGAYDLGGGLGVAYTADRRPPTVAEYVGTMSRTADELLGPGKELSIEPGRALVATAGVTLYTIESVKDATCPRPVRFVAVDGGMSDNLRPMLYDARYEADLVDRVGEAGTPCTVVGKHCESGDVLIRETTLPSPRVGDVLVMPVTGAYVYAMANNYNGVPRPPVVFCSGGNARLVVRRETYEDLHARDV